METYKDLCDHLEGIYIEHSDLKPSQQRYPESALLNEQKELSLTVLLKAFYDATNLEPKDEIFLIEELIGEEDSDNKTLGMHPELFTPYGPAFLALLDSPQIVKKFNLAAHYSSGVRLIVAHMTRESRYLYMLSFDPCPLVRLEVARNVKTPKDVRERLKEDSSMLVREVAAMPVGELPISISRALLYSEMENCTCQEYSTEEDFENFADKESLDIPFVATHLSLRLKKFHEWHWATQPTPLPTDDYSLTNTIEYLKGPVHDQYSFSHEGHGLNSYALNFRHVSGDLAIIVQSAWGGAYGERAADSLKWDDLVMRINSFLSLTATESLDESIRKYLVVASPFRMSQDIELWKREDSEWKVLENITTWEAARDLLQEEYDPEALTD